MSATAGFYNVKRTTARDSKFEKFSEAFNTSAPVPANTTIESEYTAKIWSDKPIERKKLHKIWARINRWIDRVAVRVGRWMEEREQEGVKA